MVHVLASVRAASPTAFFSNSSQRIVNRFTRAWHDHLRGRRQRGAPGTEASIPLFSWTGAYIGINGGFAWTNAGSGGGGSVDDDFNGCLPGVRAGYNWQMPNNFVAALNSTWTTSGTYVIGGVGVGVEARSDSEAPEFA
jgi:hypothetical protein